MVPKSCSVLSNFITGNLLFDGVVSTVSADGVISDPGVLAAAALISPFLHDVIPIDATASNKINFLIIILIYIKPLPVLFNFLLVSNSFTRLSKIPLMKMLLFGVEYSFAISR